MTIAGDFRAVGFAKPHRSLAGILLAFTLGAGLAACGSSTPTSSSPSSSTSSSPASSASSTSSPAAAPSGSATEKVIAANWTTFFDAKAPVAKRVGLLQDGQVFSSVIKAQAGSSLASEASAKVTKVTLVSPEQAKVTYSILVAGQPALSNQAGIAVYEGGSWKVGVGSFCGLLALENGGKTASLPAACKSAG